MTIFAEKYKELWESRGESSHGFMELCGLAHEERQGRIEFQWLPEHATCEREALARRVFKEALVATHDACEDPYNKPFDIIEPVMGHVAIQLYCDKTEFWRDVRQVAIIRPFIDTQKFIG